MPSEKYLVLVLNSVISCIFMEYISFTKVSSQIFLSNKIQILSDIKEI